MMKEKWRTKEKKGQSDTGWASEREKAQGETFRLTTIFVKRVRSAKIGNEGKGAEQRRLKGQNQDL